MPLQWPKKTFLIPSLHWIKLWTCFTIQAGGQAKQFSTKMQRLMMKGCRWRLQRTKRRWLFRKKSGNKRQESGAQYVAVMRCCSLISCSNNQKCWCCQRCCLAGWQHRRGGWCKNKRAKVLRLMSAQAEDFQSQMTTILFPYSFNLMHNVQTYNLNCDSSSNGTASKVTAVRIFLSKGRMT